jgi:hypothetical protein
MTVAADTTSTSWLGKLASLAGMGVLTLAKSVIGMAALGALVGAVCGLIAANGSLWRGLVVGLLALVVCVAVAVPLAFHRAVLRTLVEATRRVHLANAVISAVFQRMLGLSESDPHGQRGSQTARAIEGLTISQAEGELDQALAATLRVSRGGGGIRGFIMRRVHARLATELRRITLHECRQSVAPTGKIDLLRVRDSLVVQADQMLESHVLAMSGRVLKLAIIGLVVLLPLAAYAVRHLTTAN